ncbi:hypothetical protein ATCC90586_006489 [Pythium insidiosum]|nr:hypothetical protein ATCC90586_006489 [Pythium insidiosum]
MTTPLGSHRLSVEARQSTSSAHGRPSLSQLAPPHVYHSTGAAQVFSGGLAIRHGHFVDTHGRVALLRGVNLGGSSKLPDGHVPGDPAQQSKFFDDAPHVSFVNRPFPLEEADIHFARLQRWGLTFVRFIVTWEAIEHAGPGQYDRSYLTYVRALLEKASEYGILIYIDPHQDVWSRFTGGDGAPLWTLECLGLEPRHFEATKSALCMETCGLPPTEFPKMIWPTNYFKYATATMFTLFWGGQRFAPKCHVNGVQVQEFLQSHFIDAMAELAQALVGLKNIVGFGPMNEPSAGYIGVEDLSKCFHDNELRYDLAPTPFQGMCLADGIAQTVASWSNGIKQHVFHRPDKYVRINPHGKRAWKEGHRCVWQDEGVWTVDHNGHPQLLKPHYFADGDFGKDFYIPFALRYTEKIRSILPNVMLFVELPPLEFAAGEFPEITDKLIPRAINATHWYDGVTLFLRAWRPWFSVDPRTKFPAFGRSAVRKMHERQLHEIKELGRVQMHNAPTLIGETGIPFNLNDAKAFKSGVYSAQIDALDHTISCLEANLLSYTLWCYTSDNCHRFGDLWNLEDLSIPHVRCSLSLDRMQ